MQLDRRDTTVSRFSDLCQTLRRIAANMRRFEGRSQKECLAGKLEVPLVEGRCEFDRKAEDEKETLQKKYLKIMRVYAMCVEKQEIYFDVRSLRYTRRIGGGKDESNR